jgi:hypothetical protein
MSTSTNRKAGLLSRRARLRGLVRGGDGHELVCNTVKEAQAPQPIKYQRANETKRAKRVAATNDRLKPRILPKDYFGSAVKENSERDAGEKSVSRGCLTWV